MTSAGELRDSVAFDRETSGDDGYGNTVSGFAEQFTVSARIRYLRGQEPVIAQRLQGVQPAVITVRASSQTRQIDASWRARNARSGEAFNVKAVTPSDDRQWIDLLCEAGRG